MRSYPNLKWWGNNTVSIDEHKRVKLMSSRPIRKWWGDIVSIGEYERVNDEVWSQPKRVRVY